ncbi:nucleotidyl transferase AbiEii/AbiGii toxin family protein [Croceimicrobium sp.]|uniref:nucleotidyl transferase AbiEii/AbiGii toxin family protein n=1 Tax=Croceimicrobium sp. TaxID=2828340 RepID=UPI003BA8BA16
MIKFSQIPDDEKRKIYQDVSNEIGVPPQAVEKDVWVTLMLRMVFSSELAPYLIFKGGTSLSKAFDLIKRFSEDIDLGIDRRYLGFEGELSKGQIRKLRRASHTFVSGELMGILKKQLDEYGIDDSLYELVVENTQISDQDPETILVNYKSLYEENEIPYLQPKVKIEVSARSLIEPYQEVELQSWIDDQYPDATFTDGSFPVSATDPQKTFLEKLILLHEEFQKPKEKVRHFRMSRHFYDIGQILKTEHGKLALENQELFESIIAHRKALTPMKTTDYDTLNLESINIVPADEHLDNFKADYKEMIGSMIQGESGEFEDLLNEILKKFK